MVKSAICHDTSVITDILRPQAGVQEIVYNLRTELAVVQEQKLALERETANIKTSFNQLTRESAVSLAAAQADFENKMNKQEEANERLISAQEKRAVVAEKATSLAENDAKEARAAREELEARVGEMMKHAETLLTRYHDANMVTSFSSELISN